VNDVKTDAARQQPVGELRPDAVAGPVAGSRRRLWGIATLVTLPILLGMALFWAPEDANQGAAQRIFYIHVPSAWIGFLAFFVVFVGSIAFLATGKRKWDDLASSSAEVGVVFTTAVLVTGPLWGRPVWGVYWTWDPRLTSFLMLWLIYLSYIVPPVRSCRSKGGFEVLGIVGFDVDSTLGPLAVWHLTQFVVERRPAA
jgi:heme exporter protein C